jgi:hypothetical protein
MTASASVVFDVDPLDVLDAASHVMSQQPWRPDVA